MADAADVELVSGGEAFAERAQAMVRAARMELCLLSQELDPRVYASEAFATLLRTFVLQHRNTRVRIAVNNPQKAIQNNTRLVEFGRTLSTFVEFREVPQERQAVTLEEYLLADGQQLLVRDKPGDLDAKFYARAPAVVRLKQKDFDQLWNECTPAQELRSLKL